MSIVRITDGWLKNSAASEKVRCYLVDNKAVQDAALTLSVGLHGGFAAELAIELDDDHPKSDSVSDDVHEILIQARLDAVNNFILKSLAWKFSSPGKTNELRKILESKKK